MGEEPKRGPIQIEYGMAPDERALTFLEALADEWAVEIDLPHFVDQMYGSKEKVDALVRLAFVEAAYRGFEARKALADAAISAVNIRLQSELTALRERAEKAERQFREQHDIVARIWVQLGSPSYEELAGRSIYDLIDELKAKAMLTASRTKGTE